MIDFYKIIVNSYYLNIFLINIFFISFGKFLFQKRSITLNKDKLYCNSFNCVNWYLTKYITKNNSTIPNYFIYKNNRIYYKIYDCNIVLYIYNYNFNLYFLNNFINDCKRDFVEYYKYTEVYKYNNKEWYINEKIKCDEIILLTKNIGKNIFNFIENNSITNLFKSFLLYGIKNTGKFSFIKEISFTIKKNIYEIDITNINSQNELNNILKSINFNNCILVIPNIETISNNILDLKLFNIVHFIKNYHYNNYKNIECILFLTFNINETINYNDIIKNELFNFVSFKYKFNFCSKKKIQQLFLKNFNLNISTKSLYNFNNFQYDLFFISIIFTINYNNPYYILYIINNIKEENSKLYDCSFDKIESKIKNCNYTNIITFLNSLKLISNSVKSII